MSRQKIRFSYAVLGPNPREAADKAGGAEKLGIDYVWDPSSNVSILSRSS